MIRQVFVNLLCLTFAFALECPSISPDKLSTLPALDPKEFSYLMEINIPDKHLTLEGFEYYDHENATASFYVRLNSNDSKQVTYDYKYNQTYVVEHIQNSKSCVVHDLNSTDLPEQPSVFGVGIENGPLSVEHSFYWNGTYNASFVGVETIEGVQTSHYNTCLTFMDGNLTYMIDVYFSFQNWTMPAGQEAPVLLKLNAMDNTNKTWMYYFKFSDYHTSIVSRQWTPHKPSDIICRGRKDAPTSPPALNSSTLYVDAQIRTSLSGNDIVSNLVSAYDFKKNFLKTAVTLPGNGKFLHSEFYDFNQGLLYNISTNLMKCSVTPIPLHSYFVEIVNSTLAKMRDQRKDTETSNLTYGGITKFRDILSHLWIAQSPIKTYDPLHNNTAASMYIDYYIAVSKWNGLPYIAGTRNRIVSEVNSTAVTSILYDDILSTSYSIPQDFFDSRACFNQSSMETMILKFDSSYSSNVEENLPAFKNVLITTIAMHSNVTTSRVFYDNHGVYSDSNNKGKNGGDTGLYVWVTILGVPSVKGNPAINVPQANLSTALSNLRAVISSNKLQIVLTNTKPVTMTAFSNYNKTQSDLFNSQPSPSSPLQGFSSGALAGVAIGLFFAGLLVGCLIYYCCFRRGKSQYAYAMQD